MNDLYMQNTSQFLLYAGEGMVFKKISQNFLKDVHFFENSTHFSSKHCFIYLKMQSEHSGLRPDTSSLMFRLSKKARNICAWGGFLYSDQYYQTGHSEDQPLDLSGSS